MIDEFRGGFSQPLILRILAAALDAFSAVKFSDIFGGYKRAHCETMLNR
jgi:hypothetical protein